MCVAIRICLLLLKSATICARFFALDSAGSNRAARMAMMAITTSNSMRVNPTAIFLYRFFNILIINSDVYNNNTGQAHTQLLRRRMKLKPRIWFSLLNHPRKLHGINELFR